MKNTLIRAGLLSMALLAAAPAVRAESPSATLKITPATGSYATGDTIQATIALDSAATAVSGVKIAVDATPALQYVGASFAGSQFTASQTDPSVSGTRLTFSRTRFGSGATGTGLLVAVLTYKVTGGGALGLTPSTASSEVTAFSDSSNVLLSSVGASYSFSGTVGTPVPAAPKAAGTLPRTGLPVLPLVGAGLALAGGMAASARRRRR